MEDGGTKTYTIEHCLIQSGQVVQDTLLDLRAYQDKIAIRVLESGPNTFSGIFNQTWVNFLDQQKKFNNFFEPLQIMNASNSERIKEVVLGDGYSMSQPDGLNSQETKFQVSFKNVTNQEAKALLSYCELKGGVGTFFWEMPAPYNKEKLCRIIECNHTFEGYNSNDIDLMIEEVYSTSNF